MPSDDSCVDAFGPETAHLHPLVRWVPQHTRPRPYVAFVYNTLDGAAPISILFQIAVQCTDRSQSEQVLQQAVVKSRETPEIQYFPAWQSFLWRKSEQHRGHTPP
jgi:hypothetical protein